MIVSQKLLLFPSATHIPYAFYFEPSTHLTHPTLSLWFGWPYHHLRPDPLRELLLRIIIQPLRPARLYERRAFFVRLLRDLGRLQEGKVREEVCVCEQW